MTLWRKAMLVAMPIFMFALTSIVPAASASEQLASPVIDAVMSRAEASSAVGPDALTYYEKQFGLSEQVARYRLASQLMGQGMQTVLEQRYGGALADLWFDNATGKWEVAATSSVPASGIEEVFSTHGLDSEFKINRVSYTRSDLINAAAALNGSLGALVDEGTARVGYGGGVITVDVASSASQADMGRIESSSSSASSSNGSPPVRTVHLPESSLIAHGASLSCHFPYCNTVIAGAEYYGDSHFCTEGWYSEITNSSGGRLEMMLSAGHCALIMGGNFATVYSEVPGRGGEAIGYGYEDRLGEGGDWGSINMSLPLGQPFEPNPFGGYWNWAGGYGAQLRYWYNNGWPAEGTIVCHQGVGSGLYSTGATQCGVVGQSTSINETIEIGSEKKTYLLKPVLQINQTVGCHGDSGGPWFLQSSEPTAVGIFDALSSGLNEHCGGTVWITTTSEINQLYSEGGYSFGLYG